MVKIKVLPFWLMVNTVCCFNIDTDNPFVFFDENANIDSGISTYFGYSGVMHPEEKWIKIGSPKGFSKQKLGQIDNRGMIYNCSCTNGCEQFNVINNDPNDNSDRWLGSSMDINYKNNKLIMCGFRSSDSEGVCYSTKRFQPINEDKDNDYKKFNRMGEYGFSLHMPENKDEIILGAPLAYESRGTISRIVIEKVETVPSNQRRRRRSTKEGSVQTEIAYSNLEGSLKESELFGYSLNSGYFYGNPSENNSLYYVSGAPKGSNIKGEVVIFKFNNRTINIKQNVTGTQFGEYFGAAVAVGDINNDSCDDLIIGAPFYHSKDIYNRGKVYVYLGAKDSMKPAGDLIGPETNAQFGSALMFLGDVTGDGFADVAISAPFYESNGGVVYIYKGTKNGLEKNPSQVIRGEDVYSGIKGFGLSISRPVDMDNNGFQDILIGAPLSSQAVLLRTKPIIIINFTMTYEPIELLRNKDIIVKVCYEYSKYKGASADIQATLKVDLRNGNVESNNITIVKNITLKKNKKVCDEMTVETIEKKSNFQDAIQVSFSYKLANGNEPSPILIFGSSVNGTDNFCKTCPALDESSSDMQFSFEVQYETHSLPNMKMIILAITGGFILLILIFALLKWLGFFKRKQKEELKTLRAETEHEHDTLRGSTIVIEEDANTGEYNLSNDGSREDLIETADDEKPEEKPEEPK